MKTMCSVLMGVMLAMLQVGCNTLADGLGPRLGKPAAAEWANSLKPRGEAAQELTLAAEGETDYVIVIPAKPTTQEQKAADELTQWLKEMTGAVFPTVSDATPRRATEISVGRTNRLAIVDIPAAKEDLGDEGYAIAVQGKRLFLLGGRKRGPIYAAFALLEEDLGCRWYTSARAPTVGVISRIPSRPTLTFRPVPRSYVPPLVIRYPFYMEAFDGTWSLRNRTNAHTAPVDEKWGGHFNYALAGSGHTFNTLVPKSLFKEHPDYFMLNDDGKRIPKQLCLSNPEVAKIATRKVLEVLKGRPNSEIISVSANDGTGRCHCRNCKALDKAGDPGMYVREATSYYSSAGSLLHFVNQIAEAVQKEHPKVLVSTLAYNESQRAPVKSQCRDNVAIRLCNHSQILNWPVDFTTSKHKDAKDYREQVLKWSKITKNLHIWEYTSNLPDILMPTPNMDMIATAIRYYVDHGVKGVLLQGNHGWTQNAERALMRVWVMSKLLWDPSRDVVALQNDFIRGFYGKAAPAIEAYYDILADLAAGRIAKNDEPGTGVPGLDILADVAAGRIAKNDGPGTGVPGLDTMPAPAAQVFLKKATAIFDRAERLADNQQILNRVKLERSAIMYVKLKRGPEFVIQLGEDYPSLIDRFEKIARREKMGRLGYRYELDHMLAQWREKWLVRDVPFTAIKFLTEGW